MAQFVGDDDPLAPPTSLLAKLGTIVSHVQEARAGYVHDVDDKEIGWLLEDPEVQAWMQAMDERTPYMPIPRRMRTP